jgi:MEDS: MEthanogen/methylotroph, DcmR Sensory domain
MVMSGSALAGAGGKYSEPQRDLGGMSVGSHAAYLFADSAEKQQRLFALVSESLQDPSASVLYIAGKQGVKGIRFSMKDYGIDVGSIEREKKIKIVDYEEWYLTSGKTPSFKPIGIIREQFSEFVKVAEQAGYYYVTIISETDSLVRKGFFNRYRELELELGKNIALFRAIFVCAYDERELAAAGLREIKAELSSLHCAMLV